jgi:hypothetical protein
MIYVGVNIFPDDDPSTAVYYFQDTVSHSLLGSVASPECDTQREGVEVQVFPYTQADPNGSILTLSEVVTALNDALKRASWRH